ncbi:MAG: hypothetical protein RL469_830 [Pseudomonadota bacterium]|jgi:biofilm PGA synthesis N-glycosyltransferase PgaC
MSTPPSSRHYLPVRAKFVFCFCAAAIWTGFSTWFARGWYDDLHALVGGGLAIFIIAFIAIIPGYMNAFLATGLLLDRRPRAGDALDWPALTVLIPAFEEAESITQTLESLALQDYPAPLRMIVIDDGSKDSTARVVESWCATRRADPITHVAFELLRLPKNIGKARALNAGLALTHTDWLVSVDADCWLRKNALRRLIARALSDPPGTAAVAGAVMIRNSRENWITRAQEWDYFLGIGAVKRVQSLFQGVLVAQGAFSAYDRRALQSVGGWPDTVGEDIVMSWRLLATGGRIGHAEDAFAFTTGPASFRQFVRQRRRWSRGMIEAFKESPRILRVPRLSLIFIVWNALFPLMDLAYTCAFLPGLIAAAFGYFWIAGPLTLAVLPPGLLVNYIIYRSARRSFQEMGLKVRANALGFALYGLLYGLMLQPACLWGYLSELCRLPKNWGTK